MAKVTSKLQLTLPKLIADQYRIKPGDQVDWIPAGDAIRVVPANSRGARAQVRTAQDRLKLLRQMLERQRQREADSPEAMAPPDRPQRPHEIARGWRREDLYYRGRSH